MPPSQGDTTPATCPLLDSLPPELRLMIYTSYFSTLTTPAAPLLLTNKLIRHEALDLYLSHLRRTLDTARSTWSKRWHALAFEIHARPRPPPERCDEIWREYRALERGIVKFEGEMMKQIKAVERELAERHRER